MIYCPFYTLFYDCYYFICYFYFYGYFFLKCLEEVNGEPSMLEIFDWFAYFFVYRSFLIYFIFNGYGINQIFYFFFVWLWKFIFNESVHYFSNVFAYCIHNIIFIMSLIPTELLLVPPFSLIPDTGNFSYLFFLLCQFARSLLILLTFDIICFGFFDFYFWLFDFYHYMCYFIISFYFLSAPFSVLF